MSSVEITINQINTIGTIVNVSVSSINFLLGSIGLVLNIIIFIQPSLRGEPCSLYFLSSTCFNLFVVFVVIPVRIVSSAFNVDLANYNLGICKVEFFSFYVARTISCWLIALACIDRYLQSSSAAHIRPLSSLKIARWAIGMTSIGIILLYRHMIVYYEINNVSNQFSNVAPTCNAQKGIYRTFISFWYIILYSVCPTLLMFIFGCLTLNNIRKRRQIFPMAPAMNQTIRRTETQLARMLAGQINLFDPISIESELLMNYTFIPDPEFPDKNLWKYNQFTFAVDQTRNLLFTIWETYPPRPDISCLMRHNIQTNETLQGRFYNISLIALHFDFNYQHLFAIGMTRDGLSSFLWEVNQNTLTLRELIDLTSYGKPQIGSTFDILEDILYYRTETELIGIKMNTLMIKTICKLDSNPYLNNLFVINQQFYTIYNWHKTPFDYTKSNLTVKQLDMRFCHVIKQLDIEQPTEVAILTGRTLNEEKNQLVFSYDDDFSMFGHAVHVLIVDLQQWKVVNEVYKRFATSPYELMYMSSTKNSFQ